MSSIPAPTLPLTGGIVVGGHALGLSWVAATGIALVLVGFVVIRMAHRSVSFAAIRPTGRRGRRRA